MSDYPHRDQLFNEPIDQIADFAFDEKVAAVFPDMIKRSVPGYTTIVSMTGVIAERYATANSNCYDLGCSLGASTLAMRQQINAVGCQIYAIDNSPAMLDRCRRVLTIDNNNTPVKLIEADLLDIEITNASVVVLNFTLQFIAKQRRKQLIQRIYQGMNKGAILILSEKIYFEDQQLQKLNTDLHHEFKRLNGYSKLEIAQKRTAIENILIPESIAEHQARLTAAGFSSCDVWFQCFNFASLVAVK
jgi:tRNA (cmo5U34)-methyltransferase